MAIHPAYRTAKQGKDDALKLIEGAKEREAAYYALVLFGAASRFSAEGRAKDCTAAYRRAFFETITLKA